MNGRDRFLATIERRPVDRAAFWLGIPDPHALPQLFSHFGVSDMAALRLAVGDDVWPIDVPYDHPPANHIACAFDFSAGADYEERTLTTPGWFAGKADSVCVTDFCWPAPKDHMSVEACRAAIDTAPEGVAKLGVLWSAHFQDACAAFGMEEALMTMLTEPAMFEAVIERITDFYLEANEIFYQAAEGRVDAVLIGNDFGSQRALIVGPELLRQFVFPGTRKLVQQAHRHGIKVIHHSCGAVRDVIPDLVELGVDAIHPIQALATGMNAEGLQRDFHDRVSFCGGVDAQDLLVNGTPREVTEAVQALRELFPTGLIISPSHEAVLPDIPPANIEAMVEGLR